MALSGWLNTSKYEGRYYQFYWTATQSVEENRSYIKWDLHALGGDKVWYAERTLQLYAVGAYLVNKTDRVERYTGKITSGEFYVDHDTDGTANFSASLKAAVYVSTVNCTAEGTFALDTIARATTPTLSASSVDMGSAVTISTPRASSSFTHDLAYQFAGGSWATIATGVSTSYSWTVPDLASKIPNATSGAMTIRCVTKNGSTTIGTKTVVLTAKVPASVVPTISSVALSEAVSGLAAQFGAYIQHRSKIKATITAAGAKGSTIKSYSSTFQGKAYTASTWTSELLANSGSLSVVTTVTDSRGRTAKKTTTITVLAYDRPTINSFKAYRCTSAGVADDSGTYLKIEYNWAVVSLGSKNTAAVQVVYKKSTETEYSTSAVFTSTALSANSSKLITSPTFSTDYEWDVRLVVVDWFGNTADVVQVLHTADVVLDINKDGTGLGIGKVSAIPGAMEIARDKVTTGNSYVVSTPGVAGSEGYVRMASIEIRKANVNTPITFVFSQRAQSAPMTVYVLFKSTSTLTPGLDTITYEGANYGAFLVQSGDSVWDLYVTKSSEYDTIALQEWYTSHAMDDRITVTFPGTLLEALPGTYYRATPAKLQSLLDYIYPVGSVYILYSHVSPADLFGGTWVRITNAFLWATTASGTIGQTGGESTHKLTVNELPVHTHAVDVANTATGSSAAANMIRYNSSATSYVGSVTSESTGGGAAHNNMPPYVQVSVWRRTA